MAMTSTGAVAAAPSGLWAQIQQQQAQRAADQAAQKARGLDSAARQAQAQADSAQQNARTLKVRSSQADSQADSAAQGLAQSKSLARTQDQLAALHQQLAAIPAGDSGAAVAAPPPVVNTSGQTTGTLISVEA